MGDAEMIMRCLSAFVALLSLRLSTAAVRYDNYRVVRLVPRSDEDLTWISTLSEVWENRVHFWKRSANIGSGVDIMVAPHWQSEFMDVIQDQGVEYSHLVDNVQHLIDREAESLSRRKRDITGLEDFDYTKYHTIDEIYNWIWDFCDRNEIASEVKMSTSHEGRPILAVKLSSPEGGENKPIAFIQGGIHAREWISPATMISLAHKLVLNFYTDPVVTEMLTKFDWYIVPVLNPDGYDYTWTQDRMWRKNRRKRNRDLCAGVDLNRNYDYKWGGQGSSDHSCSEVYRGPNPLSEPELSGVTSFLMEKHRTNGVHLFMDFHSYGQFWLYPWGYTGDELISVPNVKAMQDVAMSATRAIHKATGKTYQTGESGPIMYQAAGGSEDWGKGSLKAEYTYVVELRDSGEHGFILPEAEIEPTTEEIFIALKDVGSKLSEEF